ncbi:MAG: sulfotransferase [Candidatus Limnocylindria bacterium]
MAVTGQTRSTNHVVDRQGPSSGPLFLVGCARTGSTLLRHILNRASAVSLASETHFMSWSRRHRLASKLASVRGARDPRIALATVVAELFADDAWIWIRRNLTVDELVDRLAAGELTERSVFACLLELYAERRGGLERGVGTRGEKTPAHLYDVPLLAAWFPESRFIHTFRDPRGIYASELRRLRQGRWGPKARFPWVPSAIVDPMLAPWEALATLKAWLDAARLHRRYARELGDRYRLVRFEDLVTAPEREVRGICDFIGVPFDDAMLDGVDVVGSSFADERHATPGFDPGAASRWRDEIHPLASRWFAVTLGGRLRQFGYRA